LAKYSGQAVRNRRAALTLSFRPALLLPTDFR
jgi:hypothetical protein